MIEISWELSYCCVSTVSFLEPSALLVWLGPALGISSWADVAAEAAAYQVDLFGGWGFFFGLNFTPYSGLSPENKTHRTHIRRTELALAILFSSEVCPCSPLAMQDRQESDPELGLALSLFC